MRITKHFQRAPKSDKFSHVDDTNWLSGEWQLKNTTEGSPTPYYQSLIDKEPGLFGLFSSVNPVLSSIIAQNPMAITHEKFATFLKPEQMIVETSFHHPVECTLEALEAATWFADQGYILNNRMHLVQGLNDSPETLKRLNHLLLMMRIRPYCIYIENKSPEMLTRSTKLMESLRGWTSGLAVPHCLFKNQDGTYSTLVPDYIKEERENGFVFRNYKNDLFLYREK